MTIRTYQPGDETAQVAIYNEAAKALPKFKPASVEDVARRVAAGSFDPSLCFYALEAGKPVAYVQANSNGRVSYPWCFPGHEQLAEPLFQEMTQTLAKRGRRHLFAAYRGDWPTVLDFFRQHGFTVVREMVNFGLDICDMPTMPVRPNSNISPLERRDVAGLLALAPRFLRCTGVEEFEKHLFANPYFPASSVFVLRSRPGDVAVGAGILIRNDSYADPKAVDASMPCFRLGAFGTEGMHTKRINGLFSFLCRDDGQCGGIAVDLLAHAAALLHDNDAVGTLAGQVPSDAQHWLRFYQLNWRRQGSFPVLERNLL